MEKILVYRFEDQDQIGPICMESCERYGYNWLNIFKDHDDVFLFSEFDNFVIEKHHRFGMKTLDSLFSLIQTNGFYLMERYGFDLVVYETSDYIVSPDDQVVFNIETAIKISY